MHQHAIQMGVHQLMTYSYGEGDNTLLLIHGGPGCPSIYLRDSHTFLANHGYRVVTWDQLGCGASDQPDDPRLWTLSRFVEEVEHVRKTLDLGKVHLMGRSWGGTLALEYCLTHPNNVCSFIAGNTTFDLPRTQRGFERKKANLGEETCAMMATREAEGTTDHPEYAAALTLLMYRHMCRTEVWPDVLKIALGNIRRQVLFNMAGPYFFNFTGNIRNFNRMDDLHTLTMPTLIIHGEHDYIIPEVAAMARDRISGSTLAMLRGCSHMPFFEKPDLYQQTVLDFLKKHTE